MTAIMEKKIENLRALIGDAGVTYEKLERITYRNDDVPSISSLRKYGLLKIVRSEKYMETMTAEEWDNYDMDDDQNACDWCWNEEENVYQYYDVINYYGI